MTGEEREKRGGGGGDARERACSFPRGERALEQTHIPGARGTLHAAPRTALAHTHTPPESLRGHGLPLLRDKDARPGSCPQGGTAAERSKSLFARSKKQGRAMAGFSGRPLDWQFLQCFGERTPGEEIQDGKSEGCLGVSQGRVRAWSETAALGAKPTTACLCRTTPRERGGGARSARTPPFRPHVPASFVWLVRPIVRRPVGVQGPARGSAPRRLSLRVIETGAGVGRGGCCLPRLPAPCCPPPGAEKRLKPMLAHVSSAKLRPGQGRALPRRPRLSFFRFARAR